MPHWSNVLTATGPYRWTMLGAIVVSAVFWYVRSKRDPEMLPVYIGALGGAFLGAKLLYILAEGWQDWPMEDRWLRLATGKTVLGGLLGGYGGVELMKWLVGYKKSTGDAFALITPLGIALGRVGCCLQGCCLGKPTTLNLLAARGALGVSRWPSAQIELVFQLCMFAVIFALRKKPRWLGRLIFLYFIGYGVFRFLHEAVRDTPRVFLDVSVYQIAALITTLIGWVVLVKRGRAAIA